MTKSEARTLKRGDRIALHGGEFTGTVTDTGTNMVVVAWDDDVEGIFWLDDDDDCPDGIQYAERVEAGA